MHSLQILQSICQSFIDFFAKVLSHQSILPYSIPFHPDMHQTYSGTLLI